jgi:hypothetical protein
VNRITGYISMMPKMVFQPKNAMAVKPYVTLMGGYGPAR